MVPAEMELVETELAALELAALVALAGDIGACGDGAVGRRWSWW